MAGIEAPPSAASRATRFVAYALDTAAVVLVALALATIPGFADFIAGHLTDLAILAALNLALALGFGWADRRSRSLARTVRMVLGALLVAAAVVVAGVLLNPSLAADTFVPAVAIGAAAFALGTLAEVVKAEPAGRMKPLIDMLLLAGGMVGFAALVSGGMWTIVGLIALVALALVGYWRNPNRMGATRP